MFTVQYAYNANMLANSISFRDKESAYRFRDAVITAGYLRVKVYRRTA